jgi:hypothetical protein
MNSLLPDDKKKKLLSVRKHNTALKIEQELQNNPYMTLADLNP